jgi:hypothetical protein
MKNDDEMIEIKYKTRSYKLVSCDNIILKQYNVSVLNDYEAGLCSYMIATDPLRQVIFLIDIYRFDEGIEAALYGIAKTIESLQSRFSISRPIIRVCKFFPSTDYPTPEEIKARRRLMQAILGINGGNRDIRSEDIKRGYNLEDELAIYLAEQRTYG